MFEDNTGQSTGALGFLQHTDVRPPTRPSAWGLREAHALRHAPSRTRDDGCCDSTTYNSQISPFIKRCRLRGRMIYPTSPSQPRMPLIQTQAGFKCCLEGAVTPAALLARPRRSFSAKIQLLKAQGPRTAAPALPQGTPAPRGAGRAALLPLSCQRLSRRLQPSARHRRTAAH